MTFRHSFLKITAILITLPAAFCFGRFRASAEDYPPDVTVFACSHETGYAGEQVMISVNIPQNTGFDSFGLGIHLPPELRPVMREDEPDEIERKKGETAEDLLLTFSYNSELNIVAVSAISAAKCRSCGNLIRFWVTIPEDAAPDTVYEITPVIDTCAVSTTKNGLSLPTTVECRMENGSITVADPNLKGDLNHDGKVSAADAVLLNRLLAEELPEPLCPIEAYDLNEDGLVTLADLRILLHSITAA